MPFIDLPDARIHYEESGSGFPVLLFAPGGMRSAIAFWERSPWNPIEALAPDFRVIAMDQRNAGQSVGAITADDGWHTYTADHVGLLDALGIDRCHVLGGCIGGPYCLGVIEAAPARVAAAVLQQPIGRSGEADGAGSHENHGAFYAMFDEWADSLRASRPEVGAADWERFRGAMYDGDFVFNVSREFVAQCTTPMLVLRGDDLYHPSHTSREIAALARNAALIEEWKTGVALEEAVKRVRAFLLEHAD